MLVTPSFHCETLLWNVEGPAGQLRATAEYMYVELQMQLCKKNDAQRTRGRRCRCSIYGGLHTLAVLVNGVTIQLISII